MILHLRQRSIKCVPNLYQIPTEKRHFHIVIYNPFDAHSEERSKAIDKDPPRNVDGVGHPKCNQIRIQPNKKGEFYRKRIQR